MLIQMREPDRIEAAHRLGDIIETDLEAHELENLLGKSDASTYVFTTD